MGRLVKKALGAVESTFPNAQIHIPKINFNRHLPKKQCTMLNQINSHITNMGRALEVLPYEGFRAEQGSRRRDRESPSQVARRGSLKEVRWGNWFGK